MYGQSVSIFPEHVQNLTQSWNPHQLSCVTLICGNGHTSVYPLARTVRRGACTIRSCRRLSLFFRSRWIGYCSQTDLRHLSHNSPSARILGGTFPLGAPHRLPRLTTYRHKSLLNCHISFLSCKLDDRFVFGIKLFKLLG